MEDGLVMKCNPKCSRDATECCAKRIIELQPDFKAQKSLVQETIEAAEHLCLASVLPKFHCKLNIIEYFWGCVKRYLQEHCDYTFTTLKENIPDALASVDVICIWKWQNHMFRWVDAYWSGL
jgi:hypothetical protein